MNLLLSLNKNDHRLMKSIGFTSDILTRIYCQIDFFFSTFSKHCSDANGDRDKTSGDKCTHKTTFCFLYTQILMNLPTHNLRQHYHKKKKKRKRKFIFFAIREIKTDNKIL